MEQVADCARLYHAMPDMREADRYKGQQFRARDMYFLGQHKPLRLPSVVTLSLGQVSRLRLKVEKVGCGVDRDSAFNLAETRREGLPTVVRGTEKRTSGGPESVSKNQLEKDRTGGASSIVKADVVPGLEYHPSPSRSAVREGVGFRRCGSIAKKQQDERRTRGRACRIQKSTGTTAATRGQSRK